MSYRLFICAFISGVLAVMSSCGGAEFNGGEDYGNLLDTPGGLILNEEKHRVGWGEPNCTICHDLGNIHLVNRTGLDIDIEEIHNDAIEEGISICAECHGNNGVQ